MKYLPILVISLLFACSGDLDVKPQDIGAAENIDFRGGGGECNLPKYVVSYTTPIGGGGVHFKTSSNLYTWSSEVSSGVMPLHGVTSTIYGYPDIYNITVFENVVNSNSLQYMESCNGVDWNPAFSAPIPGAFSPRTPSVENIDGWPVVVYTSAASANPCNSPVFSVTKTSIGWNAPQQCLDMNSNPILSCASPSLEYHPAQIVEYLVTGKTYEGIVAEVYWRNGVTSNYQLMTYSTGIALDPANPDNSAFPLAVDPAGQRYRLYLFYSTPDSPLIKYKYCGIGGNPGTVVQTPWSPVSTIPGTSTTTKVGGFFDHGTQRLGIVYTNTQNNTLNIAYTDNLGASWTIIPNIASSDRSPSITCIE